MDSQAKVEGKSQVVLLAALEVLEIDEPAEEMLEDEFIDDELARLEDTLLEIIDDELFVGILEAVLEVAPPEPPQPTISTVINKHNAFNFNRFTQRTVVWGKLIKHP